MMLMRKGNPDSAVIVIRSVRVSRAAVAMNPNFIEQTSPFAFAATLDRLSAAITAAGMTIFAQIDHAAGAQSVGLSMPPTTVLIYGNPRGGTPVMLALPAAALDCRSGYWYARSRRLHSGGISPGRASDGSVWCSRCPAYAGAAGFAGGAAIMTDVTVTVGSRQSSGGCTIARGPRALAGLSGLLPGAHAAAAGRWGKNDPHVLPAAALAYRRDLPQAEIVLLDRAFRAGDPCGGNWCGDAPLSPAAHVGEP